MRPQATRIVAILSGLRDPAHQPLLEQRRALAEHRESVGGHRHRPDWQLWVQQSLLNVHVMFRVLQQRNGPSPKTPPKQI